MCSNSTPALTTIAPTSNLLDGCFDERTVRPLPSFVLDALPLTADEQHSSAVFVLGSEFYDEDTPTKQCVSRLAVCRPVPRTTWGELATGSTIIYTEVYRFSEAERPHVSHIPALCSHVGTVRLNDAKRALLYTSSWAGSHNDQLSHEYGEVYEIWQVQRFIDIAHAKLTL